MESNTANPFDDIPDEVVEQIFKRVPLWSWKELSKVDKRFRHLVQILKPEITVIEGFDLENLMDFCVTAKKDRKYDSWMDLFPNKLVELISNFPNVIGVKSNDKVEEGVRKMSNNNWAWKYLGKNCPNLKFLFLNYAPCSQNEIIYVFEDMSKICLTYIEGVMENHLDADPCCDQIIDVEDEKDFEIVEKYPQLSFKLCYTSIYREFFFKKPFNDRLLRVSQPNMDFDELEPMINVSEVVVEFDVHVETPDHMLERLELKRLKENMSFIFPNVTKLEFYTEWMTLTECLDLLDCESKIVKAKIGTTKSHSLADDHVLQLHRLASRHNSSLKMLNMKEYNIHFANDAFIVKRRCVRFNEVDEVKRLFPTMPLPEVLPSTDEGMNDLINNWMRDVIDQSDHL